MEIVIKKGKKKIKLDVRKTGFLSRGTGLTFKNKWTDSLLFELDKDSRIAITSWFVFFPFLILWLDNMNNVLEMAIVRPFVFSLRPEKNFRKFVEIPINAKNSKKIAFFVGKSRKI